MSSWLIRTAMIAALASSAGCTLYFGDDDDCDDSGPARDDIYYPELRDPNTGACQPFHDGPYPSPCGYYADDAPEVAVAPRPDWAQCNAFCEQLDENSCTADEKCRAVYVESCPRDATCIESHEIFAGCWGIAPSGPDLSRQCTGLDAYQCSRHSNCSAVYATPHGKPVPGESWKFVSCAPENGGVTVCVRDDECAADERCKREDECWPAPGCDRDHPCPPVCYGRCVPATPSCDIDCRPGSHCELQCRDGGGGGTPPPLDMKECYPVCVPDLSCANVDCLPGHHCELECKPTPCRDGRCPPTETCYPVCVPDGGGGGDPGTCTGPVACDSLPPACPAGTKPGIANGCWTGYCIPEADCRPGDPGVCHGEVLCRAQPPACPEGTKPGIRDNCWTGYCIPLSACEPQPDPSCSAIGTERECVARMDCEPRYEGRGCTCKPDGTCECKERIFARCEPR